MAFCIAWRSQCTVPWILSEVVSDSLQPTRPQNFKMGPHIMKISVNHYLLRQLSPHCRSFEVKGEWAQTQQAKFSYRLATKPRFLFLQFSTSYINHTQFCDKLDGNLVNKNYKVLTCPQRKCTLQGFVSASGNLWNKVCVVVYHNVQRLNRGALKPSGQSFP